MDSSFPEYLSKARILPKAIVSGIVKHGGDPEFLETDRSLKVVKGCVVVADEGGELDYRSCKRIELALASPCLQILGIQL